MIKSIEVKSGYAAELPSIKGRKFEFSPFLTVLFGENGCGKSSLMKIIAGHSGIEADSIYSKGGWSDDVKDGYAPRVKIVGDCQAEIDKDEDGSIVLYHMTASDNPPMYFGDDNSYSFEEQLGQCQMRVSDGQKRLYSLAKVVERIKEKQAKNKKMIIMLDEPDRGLNFEAQFLFWKNFVLKCTIWGQTIIATHSIIPLFLFESSIIEMNTGSVERAKNIYKELAAYEGPFKMRVNEVKS